MSAVIIAASGGCTKLFMELAEAGANLDLQDNVCDDS